MNKKSYLFSVIFTLLLSTIIFGILNSNKIFKTNFVITIKGDYTSSGASRNYDATIVFVNNKVQNGTQHYFVGEGGGCQSNCNHETTCTVENQKWIDSTNGGECSLGHNEYLSKEGIQVQINEKNLKPMQICGHLDTCYEIK